MNIRLEKLILKDFMPFEYLEVDLSKNLTSIIGSNGSGKSTILEALALTFQVKERGSAVGNYIRQTPDNSVKKAYVTLEAQWLGKPLIIESIFAESGRKITRKLTYDNQKPLENMEANKFLSTYFDSVAIQIAFALQGNDKFLKASKTDNMKTLQSMFKIDFEADVKQLKDDISTATANKETLNVSLYRSQGSLEQLKSLIENLKESIAEDTKKLQGLGEEKSTEAILAKINDQNATVARLQAEWDAYIKAKNKVEETKKAIQDIEDSIEFKTKKMNDIVIEEKKDATPYNAKLSEEKEKESAEHAKQRELYGRISELNAGIKMESNRMDLIASGYCPTCKQKVEQSILDNDKSAIEHMKADLKQAQSELQESETELKDIQQRIKDYTTTIDKIMKENQLIDSLTASKESIRQSIESLIKQKEVYESMNLIEPTASDHKALEDATKALKELHRELSIVNDDNVTVRTLKEGIKNSTTSIEVNSTNRDSVQQGIDKNYEDIKKIEDSLRLLTKAQYACTACPRLFLKSICKKLEIETTKLVKQFGYDKMVIDVDEKGIDFFLVKRGGIVLNYSMLSAFEKNLVNLSLVCILEAFFDMPFLCIDELDASADTVNTQRLSILIERMLQDTQVIAISHDASLVSKWIQNTGSLSIIDLSKSDIED